MKYAMNLLLAALLCLAAVVPAAAADRPEPHGPLTRQDFVDAKLVPAVDRAAKTGETGDAAVTSARYDLLRLHQQPKHMSAWRYYLWLSYLYVLPSLNGGAWRWMRRHVGFVGALRLSWRAMISGIGMLYKIWRWR